MCRAPRSPTRPRRASVEFLPSGSGAADASRNRSGSALGHARDAPASATDPTAIRGGSVARRLGAGCHDSRVVGTKSPAFARGFGADALSSITPVRQSMAAAPSEREGWPGTSDHEDRPRQEGDCSGKPGQSPLSAATTGAKPSRDHPPRRQEHLTTAGRETWYSLMTLLEPQQSNPMLHYANPYFRSRFSNCSLISTS